MDFKVIFGILATILVTIEFLPYVRDIFRKKTQPHIYSWLVWTIIQGVGTLAMFRGGANFGALALAIGTLFCIIIFLLAFKYGTKNITKLDTVLLIAALITIVIWLIQKDPLWAVILIVIIDLTAFIPTYRKTYFEPYTETLISYIFSVLSNVFGIIAIAHYSFITTFYISTLVVTNILMVLIIIFRRRK